MIAGYDILTWLQNWFLYQCDEEWEHSFGIRIDTLDNPGWSVIIDITGTYLEKEAMDTVSTQRSDQDWVNCSVVDKQFKGYGGPKQLNEILEIFKSWADRG